MNFGKQGLSIAATAAVTAAVKASMFGTLNILFGIIVKMLLLIFLFLSACAIIQMHHKMPCWIDQNFTTTRD